MTFKQLDTKLNLFQYTLESSGLRMICKSLFSRQEQFISFEEMGSETISQKEQKWIWLIGTLLFLAFAIFVFTNRLLGDKVANTAELFHLTVGALFFIAYLRNRTNKVFIANEDETKQIEFNVPLFGKQKVYQFIQTVLQQKDAYLEQHYPAAAGLDGRESMFCATAGVDPADGLFLKKLTQQPIKPLVLLEEINGQKYFGISSMTTENKARKMIDEHQNHLISEGKFLYISDFSGKAYSLALVTTTSDPYQIMRYTGTNGCNYDVETEDIIQKYKQWSQEFGIKIVAIATDFCECEIVNKNIDYRKLSEEVYAFCPDAVDQGTGTIEQLEKEIKTTGRIFTWWD